MEIKFLGYNILHTVLRTDKSVRITIDISRDQLENVKDILLQKLPDGVYRILITPEVEEQ